MPKDKQERPRLILIISTLLLLQAPIMIALGLNFFRENWSFLNSWAAFWEELQTTFLLVIQAFGDLSGDQFLLYDMVIFTILVISSGIALVAGLTFSRGKPIIWILSLGAQIGALICGIGLYLLYRHPLGYWLLLIGIIMVLYLNYSDVRHWFLQSETSAEA